MIREDRDIFLGKGMIEDGSPSGRIKIMTEEEVREAEQKEKEAKEAEKNQEAKVEEGDKKLFTQHQLPPKK